MSEAPAPIPAEGVWTGDEGDLPNWDAMPRRNRRRKRRAPYPVWLKYLAASIALAVLLTFGQIALHTFRADPRDARVFATRELQLAVLRPNERVLAMVSVFQRPAIDYFRATRGILVLTDGPGTAQTPIGGRVIYVGLQPRDPLASASAPPTFDEREWAVDTTVTVDPTRTFFLIARALRVEAPRGEHVTLGVPSPASADAEALRTALAKKHAQLRAVGWQRREARRARQRDSVNTVYEGRRAWYHTVRRGEALASVAKAYRTTPEQLQKWNGLPDNRIRIGQTLLVKPWTKQPVPFPSGAATPEYAPKPVVAPAAPLPATAPATPKRK